MASNFSSLRSNRKTLLNKLAEQAKNESQKPGADERFWKLTVDAKTKIGFARLRFLPPPKNEELPWVRVWSHAFKGPQGQWYIENCPTTLGNRPCPVCKANNKLWNGDGGDADKSIARLRKRKLQFISNVLVLEDKAHPENEGKVFLFKYGAKIHDKLKEQIEPEFPDSVPMNPFDLWEGADFKLKSRDVEGYQNYDKSDFADASEVYPGDDDKKEALWSSEHSLTAFVAEAQFKSYEDLEKRLNEVLNGDGKPRTAEEAIKQATAAPSREDASEVAQEVAAADKSSVRSTRTPSAKKPAKDKPAPAPVADVEDAAEDEEIRNFFSGLDKD